ncbi:hypothetical protein APA_1666 [Pseudanabaena sp. lw0831]|uniref:hypothetical protein n=1 Tax=Pseudanabaena sp. lw0831 TaxID=1357935 RepID=UPI001916A2B1|nr:hypothetical protein [Pseudanabaena sp. lw0831]GBO53718.1 hypothetical protein APA_1666 [Pseudanabaena sp. lw0831]
MEKQLISQILDTYCTQSHQGLFLLSMPTGFGKTHSVLDFIYKNYRDFARQGRKIFFVTNLKKNLPWRDLQKRFDGDNLQEEFKKHVLFIDSNVNTIKANLLSIEDDIPKRYTQTPQYKELVKCLKLAKNMDKEVVDYANLKIESELEPEFRRLIEQELRDKKNFKDKPSRLRAIKEDREYQWIGKLYPAIFTDEKTVIFLSINKFIVKNSTLIEASYSFKEHLKKGSLIFIDEFDSTKETILQNIIESGIKNRIDLIDFFVDIHNHLTQIQDPKNITKKSDWWIKESSGKKWIPPDELLQTLRTKSQNIFKKYDLQHKCKSDGEEFNRKRNFLFYDYKFYSILDAKKKIVVVTDTQGNINWIRTCDNDITNSADNTFIDIRSLLIELSSFLTYFQKGISYLSQNYKHLKDEGKLDKELFAFEFAVKSLLHHFNVDDKDIDLLANKIVTGEVVYKSPQKDLKKLSPFYESGFSYFSIIDKEDHDTLSKIQMIEFDQTPESFLVDICKKAMVVGISATANINSNIGNYDIEYLKSSLNELFFELQNNEIASLQKAYEESTNGYNRLTIKAGFIGGKSLEESKVNLERVFDDQAIVNDIYGKLKFEIGNKEDGDNSIEFVFGRYAKILTAWKYFLDNHDCHGFLCLLNKLPKRKDPQLDLDKIIEYAEDLLDDDESTDIVDDISNVIVILSSENFDREKEKLLNDLANGKRRFIISTYQTVGSGQNLQFKIPQNIQPIHTNNRDKDEYMDINAIYLDKPTHLMVALNYGSVSESDLIKYIFQLEFLREAGDISPKEFKSELTRAFRIFLKEPSNNYSKRYLYKTNAYSSLLNKFIIQAIGRICRTNMKADKIHILADITIKEHLNNVSLPKNMILIHEYNALVSAASLNSDIPDSHNNWIDLENKASHVSCKTASYINQRLLYGSWSEDSKEEWLEIRQQVLRQPTVIDDSQLIDRWKPLYLQLPIPNNFYYFNRPSDSNVEISFSNTDFTLLDETTVRLSELMKIDSFYKLFIKNGWATSFLPSKYMLTPPMFNDIYKGALGEVCGKHVFDELNIPLIELDVNEFEVFDFKTEKNVYIDFKFWSGAFIRDAEDEISKIRNKMEKIKANKIMIINILAPKDQPFKVKIQKDISIIEIPYLYRDNSIDKEAINFILGEIN